VTTFRCLTTIEGIDEETDCCQLNPFSNKLKVTISRLYSSYGL
jgi:hypothetical protein